jgi:hypothetical protein
VHRAVLTLREDFDAGSGNDMPCWYSWLGVRWGELLYCRSGHCLGRSFLGDCTPEMPLLEVFDV